MNNLTFTSYNKRFLYVAIGAPESSHDARMLKKSSFLTKFLVEEHFHRDDLGDIPLVTIGDSAFPRSP